MISSQHLTLCRQRVSDLRAAGKPYCSCDELFDGILTADDAYKLEVIQSLKSQGLINPLYEQGRLLPYILDFPRGR